MGALPLVLGTEPRVHALIIGMRKLRVLPVPVEAVARMSLPSMRAGWPWPGPEFGVMKPALVRRSSANPRCEVSEAPSSTRERPVDWRFPD